MYNCDEKNLVKIMNDCVVDETLLGGIIKEEPPENKSFSKYKVSYDCSLGSEEDSEESKPSLIFADEQEEDTKTGNVMDIIYEDVKFKIPEKATMENSNEIDSKEHILIEKRENAPDIKSTTSTTDSGMMPHLNASMEEGKLQRIKTLSDSYLEKFKC
ncbi:hypothetical protein JTB14_029794 [Gonioctena quinquepunctata]|nr:hypothetical protein JTB14_029794 [Gonioctena quinquepunctata]